MLASKMIKRLQYLIDKHGDKDVNMLMLVTNENGEPIAETLSQIKQVKYRKNPDKYICDFIGGF